MDFFLKRIMLTELFLFYLHSLCQVSCHETFDRSFPAESKMQSECDTNKSSTSNCVRNGRRGIQLDKGTSENRWVNAIFFLQGSSPELPALQARGQPQHQVPIRPASFGTTGHEGSDNEYSLIKIDGVDNTEAAK